MAGDEKDITGMIVVDPKLFITCRLCLEEMGIYQIVPTVQQQIKYCFDINVEPFDGLPQLLCKKCKVLLDDYSSHKKKFIDKQQSLITRLKVKQVKITPDENNADIRKSQSPHTVPQSATASRTRSSSSSSVKKETTNTAPKELTPSLKSIENCADDSEDNIIIPSRQTLKKNKRSRLMSNSSSDTESVTTSKKKKIQKHQPQSQKWKRNYNKKFVCNICSKPFRERRKLRKHFYAHPDIRTKYECILNNICRVKLIKFDGKQNCTNLDNTVIIDKGKIIQNEGHPLYHILYTERNTENMNSKGKTKNHKSEYLESSDDDFMVSRKPNRKHRRISRSSNETVVLEEANKTSESLNVDGESVFGNKIQENIETECINIDDSSDSNTELDTRDCSKEIVGTKVEYKTIENIISNCRIKYMKKLELTQNGSNNSSKKTIYSESQLKHKLLSIGRKNIYKEPSWPVNCTGLLRYMEHKNLDVLWLPKDLDSYSRESFVRIMTKLKCGGSNDNTVDKYTWITVSETRRDNERPIIPLNNDSEAEVTELPVNETNICNAVPTTIISKCFSGSSNKETINSVQPLPLANLTSAVLYPDSQTSDPDSNSKKLLNQNPVANPKQLPKKFNTIETKPKNVADTVNSNPLFVDLQEPINENNMIMPVITSTTSLAKKAPDVVKAPENNFPRIKVKPVSELMNPPNVRNITNESSNGVWNMNNFENRVAPNIEVGNIYLQIVPQVQNVQSIQIAPTSSERNLIPVNRVTSETANALGTEYIVLDSVELPNTRTDSPFKYFKDLLLMHNIYLLDPNIPITHDYVCLLKIKVQFKQENKEKPVVLCLSLFCLRNAFCICIKDSSNIDIHMTKISANWQWEIMKIFQGDISTKILNNSMKAGQLVYTNTKTFLFLLKSISSK